VEGVFLGICFTNVIVGVVSFAWVYRTT
jgi:hypothetical protein